MTTVSPQEAPPPRVPRLVRPMGVEARVSPLELFFDLVFVFALTQVTALMADEPTFTGMARGLLVLTALWWAWSGYAWLTSTVDPEQPAPRLVIFAAMGAFLVVALATPQAFTGDALIWGLGYLAVRLLHIALFTAAASGDPALARQVARLTVATLVGGGLIVTAGLVAEGLTRDLLWILALALDYGIVFASGVAGWHVHAAHFAERFGLVMIIALGESIVAIGVGAADIELDAGEIAGGLIAIGIVCLLWWAYFDVAAVESEERFKAATGLDQLRIARDAYALLHLPMIAGIVLFALGVKKVLEHPGDPLSDMPAVAVCAGLAVYALAHVGFRLRSSGELSLPRIAAALACLALIPLALGAPGLATLAALATVWVGLIAFETVRFAAHRRAVREAHEIG